VLLLAVLFLIGLTAKERDNRFCVACHLHDEKFERLIASASTDLAGLHYRKDSAVRCIACHGGADLRMRLAVRADAWFDTMKFLAGAYAEPTHMRLLLRDAECRQCHTPILRMSGRGGPGPDDDSTFATEAETEGRGGASYHAIREHDTVRIACVRCHTSHTTDSDVAHRFISKATVTPLCRECHKEM
jgi:predicted CXXCH cytochrome family protein